MKGQTYIKAYLSDVEQKALCQGTEASLQSQQETLEQEYQNALANYQSQATAMGVTAEQVSSHPHIIKIRNRYNLVRQQLEFQKQIQTVQEKQWLETIQPLKMQIMAQDSECQAIQSALESWFIGANASVRTREWAKTKREGAQDQSGEGSALLSKTNNHNRAGDGARQLGAGRRTHCAAARPKGRIH